MFNASFPVGPTAWRCWQPPGLTSSVTADAAAGAVRGPGPPAPALSDGTCSEPAQCDRTQLLIPSSPEASATVADSRNVSRRGQDSALRNTEVFL